MSFNLNNLRSLLPTDLPWSAPSSSSTTNTTTTTHQPNDKSLPPLPSPSGPKSHLDLINECDNFPYWQTNPTLFFAHTNTYYALLLAPDTDTELGYILPSVAHVFRGLPDWHVDDDHRTLTLIHGESEEERSRIIAATCSAMRETGHFEILKGWREELYAVYGRGGEVVCRMERSASALFGVVTYGVHLTGFVRGEGGVKVWVPRRAGSKSTYPGMLDNTVAGGLAAGETAFECLVREASEEASLPEEVVREGAVACGSVSYFHIRDQRAGGETRLLQPEVQYVFDLELAEDVVPKPSDDEVEGFELMTVDEVKEALKNGEFKPNCALVLLDFFIRHGIITASEPGYIEIVSRLHRRLEFPTP